MLLGQEVAMLQSLSSLITKLSYYFSGDTTMHSQAYSIVGLYYSLHKD